MKQETPLLKEGNLDLEESDLNSMRTMITRSMVTTIRKGSAFRRVTSTSRRWATLARRSMTFRRAALMRPRNRRMCTPRLRSKSIYMSRSRRTTRPRSTCIRKTRTTTPRSRRTTNKEEVNNEDPKRSRGAHQDGLSDKEHGYHVVVNY